MFKKNLILLVKYIFLSPLFPSIKNKNYLGIYKFFNLMKKTKKKVVCLGGITKSNIKTLKNLNKTFSKHNHLLS